jgi:hypothetical protein
VLVPVGHLAGGREQLVARGGAVALVAVCVPEIEDSVGCQPDARDARDQTSHLGERQGLRAPLAEIAAEGVVEPLRSGAGVE